MAQVDKDGQVVAEEEAVSTPAESQEESKANAEGTEDESQDQKFIPKQRFDQVNERMKAAEEARRMQEAEMSQLRADMAALKVTTAPAESVIDPVKEYEGNPEGFVKHFTSQVEQKVEEKFSTLKGENNNLKFQLQVQEAAGRLENFDDYRDDIVGLIRDPNFKAINPNEVGAIDLYYTVAKERRSALSRSQNLNDSAPKVPHTESSGKRTRPMSKDPRDMSLDELRAHIGTAERD